jgi:hypothetical protein
MVWTFSMLLLTVFFFFHHQKAAEMEERIRRKLELQKKASASTFKDSLAREKEKQAELKKSKEERMAALCEELGRGC